MLSSARRGVATLRSLRFAPSSVSTLHISRLSRPQHPAHNVTRFVQASKPFSSISRHFQESALAEESEADAQSEFTKFEQLGQSGIINPVVIDTIVNKMNIHTMTEVQRMTLNQCLDGQDVIAQARTGTGKTLAFLLPIIQRLLRTKPELASQRGGRGRATLDIRGLVISPTRELAEQIAAEATKLTAGTGIKIQTAVGGTQKSYHLRSMQQYGCHILVGTPGRVNDILQDPSSGVRMDNIETFVLDEADRLLDIGFAPAIEEIQSYMPNRVEVPRQTLMFSATVPKSVVGLVRKTMRPDFKFVRTVDPNEAPTHARVPQKVVFLKGLQNQPPAILEIATNAIEAHKRDPENNLPFKAIVYYSSTNEVDMAYTIFENMRDPSDPTSRGRFAQHPLFPTKLFRMNGKLDQRVRTRESQGFREAESAILFSSDVTARGMDFPNVSHVIQLGLPRSTDDYVHRLGRTGRAGKSGEGWLLLNEDERSSYRRKMVHPSMKIEELELPTASLDMTQPAQLASNVARMLQMVETGVKNVPFNTKRMVYQSLLGVMPQQFPDRQRQDQIDMMNELARFGWGMQTPPPLPSILVQKLGYGNCKGIEYEAERERFAVGRGSDRGGRGQSRRGSNAFDNNDPFGMGQGGKGVFQSGGEGGRDGGRGGFSDRREGGSSFGGRSSGFGQGGSDRGFGRGGRSSGFGGSGGRSGGRGRRDAFDD